MKNVTMIAAVGKNLELGKDNDLIWRLKEDLKFFRNQTINKPIVMGMRTLESLPGLLPKRKHIVLTTRNVELDERIIVVHSKEELLKYIEEYEQEVMIIGGASVYAQMLEYADKLVLTEIDDDKADADVYFPKFDKFDWDSQLLSEHTENEINYKHLVYTRKKSR